jgi:magnesium-transporting ATPase (P-type)
VVVTDDRVETIVDAIIEGRAMWTSVRDALGILLGGNLGEVGFTVAASAMTGRSPLSTRQLLLVNLLTDVAPALAIALRPPSQRSPADLLAEGPERSLGSSLDRAILLRGATTAAGAMLAWTIARATGPRRRADTVALTALVGTQLAQTLLVGGRQPATVAAGLGSAAILAAVVQTPGVSQFFGCTPLDPLAWAISLGSAAAVPLLTVAAPAAVRALRTA